MNFDTMAINVGEVENMKTAIELYISEVENHIQQISGYKMSVGEGIYGAGQITTINDYIGRTCTQINSIVRYFDDFKAALDDVVSSYADKNLNISVGEVKEASKNDADLISVNRME